MDQTQASAPTAKSSNKSFIFKFVHWKFVPLLFLASIAASPHSTLISQYVYQRYAEEAGLDPTNSSFQNRKDCVENHNRTGDNLQEHVQQQTAAFKMYMSVALNIPSMFTMVMWGAMSDTVGRKVPIIAGISGNILRVITGILVIAFHWPLWVLLIGEAIHGVFGYHTHTIMYVTAAFIADNGIPEIRTIEMVMVDLWLTIGMTIGSIVTGYTLKNVGYNAPLIGVVILEALLLLYTIFLVPSFGEKRVLLQDDSGKRDSILGKAKGIITKSFRITFFADENRTELILLVSLFLIYGFAGSGGSEFVSVYAMGYPLCWRAILLSVYQGVDLTLHGVTATCITLIWKKTKWSQEVLIVIGILSSSLQYVILGFARTTLLMFCATFVGSFYIVTGPTARSIGSYMIEPSNQGALMSGFANAELVSRLLGTIAFNYIYSATMDIYEGIVFFVAAATFLLCLPLMLRLFKRSERQSEDLTILIQDGE